MSIDTQHSKHAREYQYVECDVNVGLSKKKDYKSHNKCA